MLLEAQRGWSSSFSTSISHFSILIEVFTKSKYRSSKTFAIYLSDLSISSLKNQELEKISSSKLLWCNDVTKNLVCKVGVNNHRVRTTYVKGCWKLLQSECNVPLINDLGKLSLVLTPAKNFFWVFPFRTEPCSLLKKFLNIPLPQWIKIKNVLRSCNLAQHLWERLGNVLLSGTVLTRENYISRFLIICTTVTDTIILMKFVDAFATPLYLIIIIIVFRTFHQGAWTGVLQYKYMTDINHYGVYTTWVKTLQCRLSNLFQYSE